MGERLHRALELLENAALLSQQMASSSGAPPPGIGGTVPRKMNRRRGIERERQACLDTWQILASWESLNVSSIGPQILRHELGRAIGVLFLLLDHREQALRFLADQTLDAIFRKFVLKFQAPKVIAFLLTELNKKQAPARALCAALQKLAWVVGHTKAQRASVYISHLLSAIGQCLQRPEESVQLAVERQFPVIFAQLGPFVVAAHAEKAAQIFETAMANLGAVGPKNRAASAVIAQLAKFVPSILHKSFYQLGKIIHEANDVDKTRLASALNTFRLMWPTVLENLTESSAQTLQRLLCKLLCCLYSKSNEVLVASLEFLQKVAGQAEQSHLAQQLGQFKPLSLQGMGPGLESPFGSAPNSPEEGENGRARSGEEKLTEVDSMSVLSMRTGNSSSGRVRSTWSSMDDLAAINQMFCGTGTAASSVRDEEEEETGSQGTAHAEEDGDGEEEEDDKFSVISAELFVDPLMNCFHQQEKQPMAPEGEAEATPKSRRHGTMANASASGSMTPNSTIGRARGRQGTGASELSRSTLAGAGEEGGHPLERLPEDFTNFDVNFWAYSALSVARLFLLAGPGRGTRQEGDVRTSHKIMALDFVGIVARMEAQLADQPIFDGHGHKQFLTDLFTFAGHEDDNVAISALNFAINLAKMSWARNPLTFLRNSSERGKLVWLFKKVLHPQHRNPTRLKGLLHTCASATALLCADEQLLAMACEMAILSTRADYFLVKTMRAEFLSRLEWGRASVPNRRKLQSECLDLFLGQLFDSDPRVRKATLEALPSLVENADFGQRTNLFASFQLPNCLEEAEGRQKIPLLLGLDPGFYSFAIHQPALDRIILGHNLAHILGQLQKMAMQSFSERQSHFLAALSTLMAHFPPNSGAFGQVWATALGEGQFGAGQTRPSNSFSAVPLPKGHNLLALLLECVEGISSLDELATLLRLIIALFSGISECLVLRRCSAEKFEQQRQKVECRKQPPAGALFCPSPSALPALWGLPRHSLEEPSSWHNPVERCLLLLLRVLNLYYSIAAEERLQQQHKMQENRQKMALVGAGESLMSGATALLTSPLQLLPSGKSPSEGQKSSPDTPSASSSSAKASTLSFLVGTGVKQIRQSSFTHSPSLKALEPALRGAYKCFVECLEPSSHQRFLDPFEAALRGFGALLEMADLAFVRPFLDELLLYLRMLMDISGTCSALLVHQLLKCLFNVNAHNLEGKMLGQNQIWEQHCIWPDDPVELYLQHPLNSFTLFATFLGRPEFSEAFSRNIGGWIVQERQRLLAIEGEQQQQEMNQLLHQFEPFITHLLKIYTFTKALDTRRVVLECISSLCLCNVRYELLDRNDRFQARVLAQLKQLSPEEDAPLAAHIFGFLCLLARIQFMKFAEVESLLADVLARADAQTLPFALEGAKVVLLDVISCEERKQKHPEMHTRILGSLKDTLAKAIPMAFQLAPEDSAEIWILLLHEMRQFNIQSWFECSAEFLGHFAKFCQLSSSPRPSPSPQSSPSSDKCQFSPGQVPGPIVGHGRDASRQLLLNSLLLSMCALTVPIDALLACVEELIAKFAEESAKQAGMILNNENELFESFALRLCPLLFVLVNQAEEESLLARPSPPWNGPGEEGEEKLNLLEMLASKFVWLLIRLVRDIGQENDNKMTKAERHSSLVGIGLFLLSSLLHSISSGKWPKLTALLKAHLEEASVEDQHLLSANARLANCSPPFWAFWCHFLFALGIGTNFSDFPALPAHCKSILVQILVHKKCESASKDGRPFCVEMAHLDEDFLRNLLGIGNEKLLKKFIDKLDEASLGQLKAQILQMFGQSGRMDGLMPRLLEILAKHECAEHSDLLAKLCQLEGPTSSECVPTVRAFLQQKPLPAFPRAHGQFSAKELAELRDANLATGQFYKILALHASNSAEFGQICPGLACLSPNEMAEVLQNLQPWPIRRDFYSALFEWIGERCKSDFGTDGKGLDLASTTLQCLAQTILLESGNSGPKICAEEKIFVMARIGELLAFVPELELPDNAFNAERVESLLNSPFLLLPLQASFEEGRLLSADFFRALRLFFQLRPVQAHFEGDDCRTLDILLPFLATIWEEQVEKLIPRWHRLQMDRRHWPVQVQFRDGQEEAYREEIGEKIHKMFGLVQRIVFAIESGTPALGQEAKGAFQAILAGVSLLQRMALVPETALRSDWNLAIDVALGKGGHGQVLVPLIQIHMLNEPVLQDFCWRVLWLGWSSRAQFEEFCMSLFGVLSSTPTTGLELRRRAESEGNGAVQQQLATSSLAIEALANLLLQTLLYPQPGKPVGSRFVVRQRKRADNDSLFLRSDSGKLALRAKALSSGILANSKWTLNAGQFFNENLETTEECGRKYGIGQTSLHHLWTISGLLETVESSSRASSLNGSPVKGRAEENFRPSSSAFLLVQSTELDTASSLRAIFDTFMHWLRPSPSPSSSDQCQAVPLPVPLLHSTLRSLALLSDLFFEPALFKQTFATIKPLLANQSAQLDEHDPSSKGYAILLALKCAAVLDWAELADSGEISTVKFIESLIQSGLHCEQSQFVRICTLHGLFYLFQSPALDHLQKVLINSTEFVLKELQRMQQKSMTDILTDCPTDLEDYQKLCWAFAFGLLHEALAMDGQLREQLLRLVSNSFVDPRLPTWLKLVLTRGVESLVMHSSSYAPRFRAMALECFETYQLQPGHLPFALSIYATCVYRELEEGGELAYAFNKTFTEDFQKLLNIFSFYANSTCKRKRLAIVELLSDLVSTIWAKEAVLECLWSMLMPPVASPTALKTKPIPQVQSPKKSPRKCVDEPMKVSAEFAHPLQPCLNEEDPLEPNAIALSPPVDQPLLPAQLKLSQFDQCLIHLVHLIFRKLFSSDRRVCLELALNFLLPKLMGADNAKMGRFMALVMLCSANPVEAVQQRVHFLLHPHPFGSTFFKAAFPCQFVQSMANSFISEIDSLNLLDATPDKKEEMRKCLNLLIG